MHGHTNAVCSRVFFPYCIAMIFDIYVNETITLQFKRRINPSSSPELNAICFYAKQIMQRCITTFFNKCELGTIPIPPQSSAGKTPPPSS
jgi:hypothetical protein